MTEKEKTPTELAKEIQGLRDEFDTFKRERDEERVALCEWKNIPWWRRFFRRSTDYQGGLELTKMWEA